MKREEKKIKTSTFFSEYKSFYFLLQGVYFAPIFCGFWVECWKSFDRKLATMHITVALYVQSSTLYSHNTFTAIGYAMFDNRFFSFCFVLSQRPTSKVDSKTYDEIINNVTMHRELKLRLFFSVLILWDSAYCVIVVCLLHFFGLHEHRAFILFYFNYSPLSLVSANRTGITL